MEERGQIRSEQRRKKLRARAAIVCSVCLSSILSLSSLSLSLCVASLFLSAFSLFPASALFSFLFFFFFSTGSLLLLFPLAARLSAAACRSFFSGCYNFCLSVHRDSWALAAMSSVKRTEKVERHQAQEVENSTEDARLLEEGRNWADDPATERERHSPRPFFSDAALFVSNKRVSSLIPLHHRFFLRAPSFSLSLSLSLSPSPLPFCALLFLTPREIEETLPGR